jgi:hypothetical protein
MITHKDGIVKCVIKKVEIYDLEDAKENVFAADTLANGHKYKLLIDLRNGKKNYHSSEALLPIQKQQ